MRIKGLVWLGIPAADYAAAVQFFTQTLGLEVVFDEAGTVELSAENDDRIQLFGPGHHYFELYRSCGASIVPLFEVDNLDRARDELARGGAEILGEPESDGVWTWLTFRAPDGNIHGLGARQRQRAAGQEQIALSAGPLCGMCALSGDTPVRMNIQGTLAIVPWTPMLAGTLAT